MLLWLLNRPRPSWVSPQDGGSAGRTGPLVFLATPSAVKSHFSLQIDTDPAFSSASEYRSFDDDGFEYLDGASWLTVPVDGIPASTSTTQVRWSGTLPDGSTVYSRVRQSN